MLAYKIPLEYKSPITGFSLRTSGNGTNSSHPTAVASGKLVGGCGFVYLIIITILWIKMTVCWWLGMACRSESRSLRRIYWQGRSQDVCEAFKPVYYCVARQEDIFSPNSRFCPGLVHFNYSIKSYGSSLTDYISSGWKSVITVGSDLAIWHLIQSSVDRASFTISSG